MKALFCLDFDFWHWRAHNFNLTVNLTTLPLSPNYFFLGCYRSRRTHLSSVKSAPNDALFVLISRKTKKLHLAFHCH
ncbi:MAG: hypothetical protein MUF87_07830 [Anaerolineae bacterium]|nr:hypothetical protein [Anaerolineae bacterium]